MTRLQLFLENHWLAALLLAVAALLCIWRRARIAALMLAAFAVGGITLTDSTVDSFFGILHVSAVILGASGITIALAVFALLFTRFWSETIALLAAVLGFLGLGALAEIDLGASLADGYRTLLGLQFVRPWWLVLLLLVPVVVVLARRSLAGLGPVRKWLAIGARTTIIALLAIALAEPRLRRPSDHVTVMFVIDRSLSVPQDVDATLKASDQVDRRWQRIQRFVDAAIRQKGVEHRADQTGVVLFGKRPKLAFPPASVPNLDLDDRMAGPVDRDYTDIAAALKLAIASFPEGTGRRIVLISDGNENLGNAEEQAAVAKQNNVQIDTVALAPGYRNESEVLVQAVEAPRATATGVRLPVRVLVRNSSPNRIVEGLLELVRVGVDANGAELTELVPIDDKNPQVVEASPDGRKPPRVRLIPGLNAFRFQDRPNKADEKSYTYRATITPIRSANENGTDMVAGLPGDRVANNKADTAVVSRGQRKVLFIDDSTKDSLPHGYLISMLRKGGLTVELRPVAALPEEIDRFTLALSDYDCIILANVPADAFSNDRMEAIRSCVHDQGCGLVMIGGPDSFGPGGYQGTPVEAALPVDCEIKALKAAGRGGLVLVMHASEMANGNKWQKDIAKLAVQRLNPNDLVGLMQYGFGGGAGVSWVIPFQEIGGNKNGLLSKIDGMTPGDMPDFDPFLQAAVTTLTNPDYGLAVRHTIVISDGDPQYGAAGMAAVKKMFDNNVTCTTIGVATHSTAESGKLRSIAKGTKDGKGNSGNYYEPKDPNELPAIYIKESRRISQSFIYDKPFTPALRLRGGPTEGLPDSLPQLKGFVRTTLKESTLAEMRIEGPKVFDQQFPILANWQYGLGKAVAFTSDARTQPGTPLRGWDQEWAGSDVYSKFWEQAVNWAMRAAEKGKMTIVSEYRDGRVRVTVDARDEKDRPVSGLDLKGGITLPKPLGPGDKIPTLTFKKKGAGLYEGEFPAEEAGSYFAFIEGRQAGVGGQPGAAFDAARTGVTVPYSPEFADLESNTPLLKRLAESTGGQFHTDDDAELTTLAKSADLFRDAPKAVRAILPFWYWLVFAGGMLLLFDVGVRRVSLEWAEVRGYFRRKWTSLRTVPDAVAVAASLDRLSRRKFEVAERIEQQRATRKFDPTGSPSVPAPAGADELISDTPRTGLPVAPPERPVAPPAAEDLFSKLKKAKGRVDHNKDRPEPQR